MSRVRRRQAGWILGAVTAVVVVVLGALGLGGRDPSSDVTVTRAGAVTKIQRQTLQQKISFNGNFGYGPETPLSSKATGTITWLPPIGATVRRNSPLLRVDDRPVTLLYGEMPMYRRLGLADSPPSATDSSAAPPAAKPLQGRDVRQLEENLKTLGYAGFTVDDTFTAQTAQAIRHWQRDLGVPDTGAVDVADVYYAAGPLRVGRILVRLGAPAGGEVFTYTATTRLVVVNVAADAASWAVPNASVEIALADGRVFAGKVETISAAVAAPDPGNSPGGPAPSASVTVTSADAGLTTAADGAALTVRYVVDRRENVLAVPAAALLALAEGGYGLEVVEGSASRIVAVDVGLFADGLVEVTGVQLRDGIEVRLPA